MVEIIRRQLGPAIYRERLRELFRPRRDPETGCSWTRTQEAIVRCNLAGVVTTNYDPGIVNARMAVRPTAAGTGFASWTDESTLDRWRTGDVFGDDELPVLYAHGHHNQPDSMVLATTEYRRAYAGKLSHVLARVMETRRLLWIGFSFTDRRIAAILREIGEATGTHFDPGEAPRHLAIMPWDPNATGDDIADPTVLRSLAEIEFGTALVLYPAPRHDHSALWTLLDEMADERFPSRPLLTELSLSAADAGSTLAPGTPAASGTIAQPVAWVHGGDPVDHFIGRVEELARLDRWAADTSVRLIGVTAWGGAGKTALVTQWLTGRRGLLNRDGVKGMFAWSFYENRSAEAWALALLDWAKQNLQIVISEGPLADRVIALMLSSPVVLVLDGLEVAQEGPTGVQFGRLLDGILRSCLTGLCQFDHGGLILLTSRFPFADLEQFDGDAVRMLDVPPFDNDEGAMLLEQAGARWLPRRERRRLVKAVDGHALAVSALAGALRVRLPTSDLKALLASLEAAGRTDARVARVLAFYAERLSDADAHLVALVSLFQRPVPSTTVLALGADASFAELLKGWTPRNVEESVRQQLSGLLTWHADGTVSAHPLVRDSFRPLALSGPLAQRASELTLADLPAGPVTSRDDALKVVEMIELLLDVDQWEAADALYRARTEDGRLWTKMPAAVMGQRCAAAFAATPERERACAKRLSRERLGHYRAAAGLFAFNSGDVVSAEQLMSAIADDLDMLRPRALVAVSRNLCQARLALGDAARARRAASTAARAARNVPEDYVARERAVSLALVAATLHHLGDSPLADERFHDAGLLQHPRYGHLSSIPGCLWAEFLIDTSRFSSARRLIGIHHGKSWRDGRRADTARWERALARCDLEDDAMADAGDRLATALDVFRDGDYLVEWAMTLPYVAEHRRRTGDIEAAERLVASTLAFAGPRALVLSHSRALAVRAHARCDRGVEQSDDAEIARARDDADHALRLATRARRLPWLELEAVEAHASLDETLGEDNGWTKHAHGLRAYLVPDSLDPDPLATIELISRSRPQSPRSF
ncbi:MAG: SIR2 family protein [Actinomycetota bacterium]